MTELLPCPFCGGHSELSGEFSQHYMILCTECGARTDFWDESGPAIAAWNRRAYQWIDEGEEFHSAPGEYGRNPVTAEDVLRAAAQMRAEVEVKEKNLMTDSQREAMVLEMKAASLKSYVERQAATDKAERDLLATVAGDGYSYMVLWAFEGGEPYLVRMGKKKPLDTEEGS